MKNSIIITGIAILSFLFIWCSIEFYFNYRNTEKRLSDRFESLFLRAIEEDQKLMFQKYSVLEKIGTQVSDSIVIESKSGRQVFRKPLDAKNISLVENQKWRSQHLITAVYPHHTFTLDSVFRSLLPAPLQTAVWCTFNRDTSRSPADSHFYKKAITLKPVVFEWSSVPETRIELRAFVEYPFFYIIGRMPNIGLLILIWLISIGGIICNSILYGKRKKSVPEEFTEVEKPKIIIEQHIPVEMKCIQLSDTLLYNQTLEQLIFGEKTIQLAGNSLKLFKAFMDSPEYSLGYLFISTGVLGRPSRERKVVNEITGEEHTIACVNTSDRNAIYQIVKVLRGRLEGLPVLINQVGDHYRLILPTDTPNPGDCSGIVPDDVAH